MRGHGRDRRLVERQRLRPRYRISVRREGRLEDATASGMQIWRRRERESRGEATDDSTRGIAAEWWEELREFRTTHRPKRASVDGVGWEYIASGDGEEALLILPGRAMVGEAVFTRPSRAATGFSSRCLDGVTLGPGVYTFRGAGHTPWMSRREEHLSVSKELLDQEEGTRT
jgi:hypothetical protein